MIQTPKDTLLVMTQICAGNKKFVPFVAQGSNNEILREAATIEELPITIKKMISNCHGPGCTNQQERDTPIASHLPIEIFSQLSTRKLIIRGKDAVKKLVKQTNHHNKNNNV